MKREDGRKTEQLHIVLSKEEKAAFYQLVAQETKRTGEQYTITRLIKEKVLYSLQESRVLWRRKELAGHEKGTGGNTEKSFRDPLAVTGRGRIRWQLQFWIILAKKREGQQSISKMQFGTF